MALFPNLFYAPFAEHHVQFWEHVESIRPGAKPAAFVAIWPRGGAKTTNAEGAVVRLGATGRRKFCLYVRGTQDKANESVGNVAAMLESQAIGQHYPDMANRKLSKYGHSRGWRVDMLRSVSGFSMIGLGLDAAVRGIKIEEFRPDLIVLDDIDDKQDSGETVRKKVDTLTSSVLPAGSSDAAVIGVQNLMHPGSIFSQIAAGSADFLHERIVSGPHPAILDLEYERRPEGGYRILGGAPTWAGQDLDTCQAQINEWGLTAFLAEAQHEVENVKGGIFSHLEYRHVTWDEVPELVRVTVWVDPAVSATDKSDSMGIQADGLAGDKTIYRLWSWEQITTPVDALKRAILKAVELGALDVGVETDQGGDTWESVYREAVRDLKEAGLIGEDVRIPAFAAAKAGAGHGPKTHRASLMLTDYERGKIVHVLGTHTTLEKALKRFPVLKPFDLTDAAYWSWQHLRRMSRGWARGS